MIALNRLHAALAAAALLGLSALPAHAVPTDTILFKDIGSAIIVDVDGAQFGICHVEDVGCTIINEPTSGTVPSFNLSTSAFPVNFNIYDDAAHTKLSDTLSLSLITFRSVPNTVSAVFKSFGGTPLTPLTGGIVNDLLETNAVQDLGTVTFVNDAGAPVYAADYQFISDEEPTAVPEPSSLLVLSGALLGLAGLSRRAARKDRTAGARC